MSHSSSLSELRTDRSDGEQEYGSQWRRIRKFFHAFLQLKSVKAYVPYIELESTSVMVDLLDKPQIIFEHVRRYSTSIASQLVYGFRMPKVDDPRLLHVYEIMEGFSEITGPGAAALLDIFPILRYLPPALQPLRGFAIYLRKISIDLAIKLWLEVKQQMQDKTAKVRQNPFLCSSPCAMTLTDSFAFFFFISALFLRRSCRCPGQGGP